MKTFMANPDKLEKKWYLIDAEGCTLGRLSSEIAKILSRKYPEKKFYTASENFTCGDMKKITLEALRDCLKYGKYEVKLTDEEIAGARRSLDRMVSI